MADKEIHPGSFVGDTVEEFKRLPTWGKVTAGVVVVGVIGLALYMKSRANAQTSASAGGSSSGLANLAPTDLSGGTASGPTPTPTPTPTPGPIKHPGPPPKPVQSAFNLSAIMNGTGLLGKSVKVSYSNGQLHATQGGFTGLLSSILPKGTRVWQGNQGRWWYALPGEDVQYLLTSGSGPANPANMGIDQDHIPSSAYTVGSSTSHTATLQQGKLPTGAHPVAAHPAAAAH